MTPESKVTEALPDQKAALEAHSTGSGNALPIGTRLAEFEISDIVGEGGFGTVYLAFDHSLQRTVAIKEYMPAALSGRGASQEVVVRAKRHRDTFEAGLKSFINEARLLAQFDHPALIKVYRFWEQNNTAYMAMRYYEGKTFRQVINTSPELITEAWLKPVLKPLLEALDTLYRQNILHRDISPDNIMILPDGSAVLLDFGAARQIISDMTQALTVILKPGYAPVEQYADDNSMKQGPWTDIYALCAVMYLAITKKPPPTSVARMIKDPIEPLASLAPKNFSIEFLSAIDKGMSVRPEDRPQSIAEFSGLLKINNVQPQRTRSTSTPRAETQARPERKNDERARDGNAKGSKSTSNKNTQSTLPNLAALLLISFGLLLLAFGAYRYVTRPKKIVTPDASTSVVAPPVSAPVATPAPSASPPESSPKVASTASDRATEKLSSPTLDHPQTDTAPATTPSDKVKPVTPSATTPAVTASSAPVQKDGKTDAKGNSKIASSAAPATGVANSDKSDNKDTKAVSQSPVEGEKLGDSTVAPAGFVKMNVRPWGTVYVDGNLRGVSPPMKRISLPEGKHQIRVVNPNFADRNLSVNVSGKKPASVEVDFTAN